MFLTPNEFDTFVADVTTDERIGVDGVSLVVIEGDEPPTQSPGSLPIVVAWVADVLGGDGPVAADVVVGPGDVDRVAELVATNPLAATSLATLLRGSAAAPVDEALALESANYSMLQAGPEFAAWRSTRPPALMPTDDAPTVRAERHDDVVTVELHRPARHNAITSRLRDDLVAALTVAAVDDTVERVVLRGAGASFCSGGDLDEFGSRADPATAHRIRLARSPARLLHRLAARLHVQLHGAVLGGGIEMAAFAGRVTAHPDTRFGLPETRLGLVPGAGGTVSLPRRIGRQRTMALAIGTDTIGVDVALEWGLVDEIDATWNG